jgi:hypothetical protein
MLIQERGGEEEKYRRRSERCTLGIDAMLELHKKKKKRNREEEKKKNCRRRDE